MKERIGIEVGFGHSSFLGIPLASSLDLFQMYQERVLLKKEFESHPFIMEIYLPNCVLVGPYHKIELIGGQFKIIDDFDYPDEDISDEEFVRLLKRS